MNRKQIYGWVAVAVISCSIAMALEDSVTATAGEPYILKFDYSGSRRGVKFHYTKDGERFFAERSRVFTLLRRVSFVEITEDDAGVYTLEVNRRGVQQYSKTITLTGTYIYTYVVKTYM